MARNGCGAAQRLHHGCHSGVAGENLFCLETSSWAERGVAPVTVRGRLGDHAGALGQARDAARLLAQGVRKGSRGQGRRPRGSPVASDATILWRRDARRRPDTIRAPLTTGWATVPRAGVAQNPPPFRGQGRHTLGVLDPDPRPRSTSSGSWLPVDRVDAAFPLVVAVLTTYILAKSQISSPTRR